MNSKEEKILVTVMQQNLQLAVINQIEYNALSLQRECIVRDKENLVKTCKNSQYYNLFCRKKSMVNCVLSIASIQLKFVNQ